MHEIRNHAWTSEYVRAGMHVLRSCMFVVVRSSSSTGNCASVQQRSYKSSRVFACADRVLISQCFARSDHCWAAMGHGGQIACLPCLLACGRWILQRRRGGEATWTWAQACARRPLATKKRSLHCRDTQERKGQTRPKQCDTLDETIAVCAGALTSYALVVSCLQSLSMGCATSATDGGQQKVTARQGTNWSIVRIARIAL